MSTAVSDCFWRMVRETIEAQADAFRAARFNLETEWKNTYPRIREMDRNDLYDKARSEILDDVVNLSMLSADEWDRMLSDKLLRTSFPHIFDQILMPSAAETRAGAFKTAVDIRLRRWVEKELAALTVAVGWQSFKDKFVEQVQGSAASAGADTKDNALFKPLKHAVVGEVLDKHRWDGKASDYLVCFVRFCIAVMRSQRSIVLAESVANERYRRLQYFGSQKLGGSVRVYATRRPAAPCRNTRFARV